MYESLNWDRCDVQDFYLLQVDQVTDLQGVAGTPIWPPACLYLKRLLFAVRLRLEKDT
jgi:hypothetical protein